MQITLNPADELPSTLRAVALLLNSIASDRDGGKAAAVNVQNNSGQEIKLTVSALPANPGNAQDAPGASDPSQTPPPPPLTGANAQQGSNGAELDANGLPWIEEIHSSSKNKNQDGTWRYIRGGDPAMRAQVEARVRAEMAGDPSDAPPPPPPVTATAEQQTPPPPPPIETKAEEPPATQVTMQEVFKRLSNLSAEQRTQSLEVVELNTPAEFLREVKTRPELAGELLAAIVMITGEE